MRPGRALRSLRESDGLSSRCFFSKDIIKDCHGTKERKEKKLFFLSLQSGGEESGGTQRRANKVFVV